MIEWHGRPARELTRKMRVPPQSPIIFGKTICQVRPRSVGTQRSSALKLALRTVFVNIIRAILTANALTRDRFISHKISGNADEMR